MGTSEACEVVRETAEASKAALQALQVDELPPGDPLKIALGGVLVAINNLLRFACPEPSSALNRWSSESPIDPPPLLLPIEEASHISGLLYAESERFNDLATSLTAILPASEARQYNRLVARVMGAIYADVLRPLWTQHPKLDRNQSIED